MAWIGLCAIAALGILTSANAWWSEGTLPMDREFSVYVGKFCFDFMADRNASHREVGFYNVTFEGQIQAAGPVSRGDGDTGEGRLWMMVFSDEKDHWMRVRPFWDELTCKERLKLASWANPLPLTSETIGNFSVNVLQAVRPRFWYFSFVNCGANITRPITYAVHAVNLLSDFEAEFSLDVSGSVYLEAAFTILFAFTVMAAGCCGRGGRKEASRGGSLLRLLCASATCSAVGSLLRATHHLIFAVNGHGAVSFAVLGAFSSYVAKALLTILQFIVAKGWAVLYRPDDWPKRFMFLFGISSVVFLSVGCEIWEQYFHDQSTAYYHYESWPGRLILLLNMCLLATSNVIMAQTYSAERHREVRIFYILVTVACGVYMVALPVVCLLAELLDPWVRRKYVERTEISTRFAATALLLLVLRPSRLDPLIAARLKNGSEPELLADKGADEAAPLDVEAAIATFLADDTATSLELPNLTAEQRKCARKLADQHSDLKCESYGFGAERRLHFFKRAVRGQPTPGGTEAAVRVKNTFIDDWIAPEGGDGAAEPVVFRSMPQGLPKHLLEPSDDTETGKLDLAPAADSWSHPEQPAPGALPPKAESTSPGCSTTASAASGATGSTCSPSSAEMPNSPASSNRDRHALPEGVEVRNTFIHVESAPVDERVIQSMPHGMFRQSLLEEARHGGTVPGAAAAAAAAAAGAAQAVPPVASTAPQHPPAPPMVPPSAMPPQLAPAAVNPVLAVGSEVMVEGLTKFPAFNGLVGFVQALDEAIGRYDVLLVSPAAPGGRQWAKIKAENLRVLRPAPPPCYAPTVVASR